LSEVRFRERGGLVPRCVYSVVDEIDRLVHDSWSKLRRVVATWATVLTLPRTFTNSGPHENSI